MNTNCPTDFKPLPDQRHVHNHADRAFTLVELMVVLATLGILAVLLLPALASSTQPGSAKSFQCLNNLRQMAQAWTLYAEDNHDRLVNNWDTVSINTDLAINPPLYRSWVCDIMTWVITQPAANQCFKLDGIVQAPFNAYLSGNVTVYKCPADNYLSPLQRAAGWTARPRSYSMNCFFGATTPTWTSTGNEFFPTYRQFLRAGTIPNPANLYVFLEEHPDSINDGYFLNNADSNIGHWSPNNWKDLPGSNHAGSGGFSFADGHSEIHKWKSTVCTILPVKFSYSVIPFSADTTGSAVQDAQWLALHSSVLR